MIRILVIEDDTAIARAHERVIRRALDCAHEVVTCHTAEGGIAALSFASEPFALVLSDWNLGGVLDGGDVIEHVRTMATPPAFVFVTDDDRAATWGVPWLQKPVSAAAIRGAVLAAVEPPKVVMEVAHV